MNFKCLNYLTLNSLLYNEILYKHASDKSEVYGLDSLKLKKKNTFECI